MWKSSRKHTRGIGLLEVVLTVSVLTIALAGMTYIFAIGVHAVEQNRVKQTMRNLAKDLMEEVLSKDHWRMDRACSSSPQYLGPEAGESRSGSTVDTAFDDVDDYNNYNEAPPKDPSGTVMSEYTGYRRDVVVEYLSLNDATGVFSASLDPTGYKRITVIVKYSRALNFASPDMTYTVNQIVTPRVAVASGSCVSDGCAGKICGDDGCGAPCGTCPAPQQCQAGACCTPNCGANTCGDNGCGGYCGFCFDPQICASFGTCCTQNCAGRECGDDNCGGSCGTCLAPQICMGDGSCCLPDCAGKTCGDNGCGGTCGACTSPATCRANGTCCAESCAGKTCGDNGCGGTCGNCSGTQVCNAGTCCTPSCAGKECGSNGCGGSCGVCSGAEICTGSGRCCTPSCAGKECGSDGCGGVCGNCLGTEICTGSGTCCTPNCGGRDCGQDGCGGICGTCPSPLVCSATGVCHNAGECVPLFASSFDSIGGIPYQGFITVRSGNADGWRVGDGPGIEVQNRIFGPGANGNQYVELDSDGPSSMWRTVATTPGTTYILKFYYKERPDIPGPDNRINVWWNNSLVVDLPRSAPANWTLYTFNVTATGSSSTLTFSDASVNDSLGGLLDAISLCEPSGSGESCSDPDADPFRCH